MGIFGKTKNIKKAARGTAPRAQKKAESAPAAVSSRTSTPPGSVLLRPRMTEKSAQLTAQRTYTFDISPRATKTDVAEAVRAVYKVVPEKVRIVRTPGKRVRLRTRRGTGVAPANKKAYVYLKEGDRIEFSS